MQCRITPAPESMGATVSTPSGLLWRKNPRSLGSPQPSTCSPTETAVYALGVGPKPEVMFFCLWNLLIILSRFKCNWLQCLLRDEGGTRYERPLHSNSPFYGKGSTWFVEPPPPFSSIYDMKGGVPSSKRTLCTSGGFKTQGREEKILVIIMIQGMRSVTKTHAVSEPSA